MPVRRSITIIVSVLVVSAGCGSVEEEITPDAAVITSNVANEAADVAVDTFVQVDVGHGTLDTVQLADAQGTEVTGDTESPKDASSQWVAGERLEPGTTYTLAATATGDNGVREELRLTFATRDLTLDEQTYPSVAPLAGETVGVGMPVIVMFDIPVEDRAEFERHMDVTSKPAVEGSWSWLSDREVHYRPKDYWPAGANVNISLDLNSVPAGNGIYGQQDQDIDFTVGKKVVNTVDLNKHTLTHVVDDEAVRTLPISAGDSRHQSRNGIKVIMEKFETIDMDAATTGVDSDDPDYYNMKGVKWAMRVTNSGEFLHAAPWNAGRFGRANVSHGCTGLSTAHAGWLYQRSRRGDIVVYKGGTRALEDHNGWTDWNVDWDDWVAESALADADLT